MGAEATHAAFERCSSTNSTNSGKSGEQARLRAFPEALEAALPPEEHADRVRDPCFIEGREESTPGLVKLPPPDEHLRDPKVYASPIVGRLVADPVLDQCLHKLIRCRGRQELVLVHTDRRRVELRRDRQRVLSRLQRQVDERGEYCNGAEQLTECAEVLDGQGHGVPPSGMAPIISRWHDGASGGAW